MDVIFLDIDGVLNDYSQMSNNHCGIKKECVENFNKILDLLPDVKIVISSSWRYLILNKFMTIKGFESLLLSHGINCSNRVIGHTEIDESNSIFGRGSQIKNWVSENNVNKYLGLDDLDLEISR